MDTIKDERAKLAKHDNKLNENNSDWLIKTNHK